MPEKKIIKIRYNTENKGNLFWRVIADGKEVLADEVIFMSGCFTTRDRITPEGPCKAHVSAYYSKLEWALTEKKTVLIVK